MSKLLEQVRDLIRVKHYSIKTEEAYLRWIKNYILFHKKRHPKEMGNNEVGQYLTHLAVNRKVAASTQNQALSALVFLYSEVLKQPFDWLEDVARAKRPSKLPVVFTKEEAHAVLRQLDGAKWLMASLLYGSGLRLMDIPGLLQIHEGHEGTRSWTLALPGSSRIMGNPEGPVSSFLLKQ